MEAVSTIIVSFELVVLIAEAGKDIDEFNSLANFGHLLD